METICHCVAGIHPVVRDPPRDTGWRSSFHTLRGGLNASASAITWSQDIPRAQKSKVTEYYLRGWLLFCAVHQDVPTDDEQSEGAARASICLASSVRLIFSAADPIILSMSISFQGLRISLLFRIGWHPAEPQASYGGGGARAGCAPNRSFALLRCLCETV